jgi:LAO/AO transport system kinase
VLDAFGMDRILVETVGVGQSELDIARLADTSAVILVPESGDAIQTLKAGVMEIADCFVVNKADRPGADRLRNDIEVMLGLRGGGGPAPDAHHGIDLKAVNPKRQAREAAARDDDRWTPPVLRTIGSTGEGMPEFIAALDRHFAYLERSGTLQSRRRERLRDRVRDVVEHRIHRRLWRDEGIQQWVEAQLPALERGEVTPFTVAEALLARSVAAGTFTGSPT